MPTEPHPSTDRTADPAEVAKFAAQADRWWDPAGPFAPLLKLNPARIAYIRDRLAATHGRDPRRERPLAGLHLLDVGCGGGLLCEPMARLGATVTGIDAAAENIRAAAAHAREMGLAIDYRCVAVERLAGNGARYDAVLNMEIVEHVADLPAFLAAAAACVAPGGALFVATLNRTVKAYLLAILGAEHLLRWLPGGSHDWSKFVRPAELVRLLTANGLTVEDLTGLRYDLLADRWTPSRDLAVNYMLHAVRPAPG